jgi:hypothetical protein
MQNKKSVFIVRIIAIIVAVMALVSLPSLFKIIWLELSYSPQGDAMSEIYVWNLIGYSWFALLFILKIISAYGLFQIRIWAWKLAIAVFSVEFFSRLYSLLSIPNEAPTLNHSEDVIIGSFSLWPFYIQTIIPLYFINHSVTETGKASF